MNSIVKKIDELFSNGKITINITTGVMGTGHGEEIEGATQVAGRGFNAIDVIEKLRNECKDLTLRKATLAIALEKTIRPMCEEVAGDEDGEIVYAIIKNIMMHSVATDEETHYFAVKAKQDN